jgi:hypothetical protein
MFYQYHYTNKIISVSCEVLIAVVMKRAEDRGDMFLRNVDCRIRLCGVMSQKIELFNFISISVNTVQ